MNEQILVIGATNRVGMLDPALMRPGRFDKTIHMGLPSEPNRIKILESHSRDKPVGIDEKDKVAILNETSKLTLGPNHSSKPV